MANMGFLTTKEAAERSRIHVETFRSLIRSGRGPVLTVIGSKRLVREDALATWLDHQTRQSPMQAAE